MSEADWIVFSDLGMAIWSHRRLVLDLALAHKPESLRVSSERKRHHAFSWWVLARDRISAKDDEYSFLDASRRL